MEEAVRTWRLGLGSILGVLDLSGFASSSLAIWAVASAVMASSFFVISMAAALASAAAVAVVSSASVQLRLPLPP